MCEFDKDDESKDDSKTNDFHRASACAAFGLNFAQYTNIDEEPFKSTNTACSVPESKEAFDDFLKNHEGEWLKDQSHERFAKFKRRWQETRRAHEIQDEIEKLRQRADYYARHKDQLTELKAAMEGVSSKVNGLAAADATAEGPGAKPMSYERRIKITQGDVSVAQGDILARETDWQHQTALHLAVVLAHADLVSSLLATEEGRTMAGFYDGYNKLPKDAARGWSGNEDLNDSEKAKAIRIQTAFEVVDLVQGNIEIGDEMGKLLEKLEDLPWCRHRLSPSPLVACTAGVAVVGPLPAVANLAAGRPPLASTSSAAALLGTPPTPPRTRWQTRKLAALAVSRQATPRLTRRTGWCRGRAQSERRRVEQSAVGGAVNEGQRLECKRSEQQAHQ